MYLQWDMLKKVTFREWEINDDLIDIQPLFPPIYQGKVNDDNHDSWLIYKSFLSNIQKLQKLEYNYDILLESMFFLGSLAL